MRHIEKMNLAVPLWIQKALHKDPKSITLVSKSFTCGSQNHYLWIPKALPMDLKIYTIRKNKINM